MSKIALSVLFLLTLCLPAAAAHRSDADETRLELLAQRLENVTDHVRRSARVRVQYRNPFGRRALDAVARLNRSAIEFQRDVARNQRHPRQIAYGFERVVRDFQRAEARVANLRDLGHLNRDLDEVGRILTQIDRRFAKRWTDRDHHAKRQGPEHGVEITWNSPRHGSYRHGH